MYTAAIFNDIISIIVHLLLWVHVMLDFICTCFAELWGTGREQNMQNETLCLKRDFLLPIDFRSAASEENFRENQNMKVHDERTTDG